MKILGLIAGAAMLLGAQGASAATITNGSFENGIAPGSFTTVNSPDAGASITGWNVDSGSVDYIGSYWAAQDGSRSIDLSGNSPGSIWQNVAGLVLGQEYKVSFFIRGNGDGGVDPQVLSLSLDGITSFYAAPKSATAWALQTFIFTFSGTSDELRFTADGTNGAFGPGLDNVTIAATPIPGALLLFGSALGGMGFLGYRRKKLQAVA